jgi:hypothetical protein
MQTEIFTLCDAATMAGGKLNILGSFDTIGAHSFPCDHPLCVVACKVRFDLGEEGIHMLQIDFCDPDLRPVLKPMKREVDVAIGSQMSQAHVHLWQHMGFHLERPGEYYFELKIDGKTQSRIPLCVVQVQPQNFTAGCG